MCADSSETSDPGTALRRLAGDPPSVYEAEYGYCRVVEAGSFVFIAGTTSVEPSGYVVGTTPYEQTVEILRKLAHELSRVGLTYADVVQTRVYVTDISRSDEVGRAHGEVFATMPPAATMVEVTALIDPRMLVEIELVAFRP